MYFVFTGNPKDFYMDKSKNEEKVDIRGVLDLENRLKAIFVDGKRYELPEPVKYQRQFVKLFNERLREEWKLSEEEEKALQQWILKKLPVKPSLLNGLETERRHVHYVHHVQGSVYLRRKILHLLESTKNMSPIQVKHIKIDESVDIVDMVDISEEIAPGDEIWIVTLDIDTFFDVDERTGKAEPSPVKIAKWLIKTFHILTTTDTEDMYWYDEGVYRPDGEVFIKTFLETVFGEEEASKIAGKVIKLVKIQTYMERKHLDPKHLIAVENGVIDLRTLEFKPHDPKNLIIQKLPVKYDPDADCPRIKKFFREVMHHEDIPVAEEIIGYCLLKDTPFHKAICLIGDGANGKSTFLMLLRRFLGPENTTSISLQALAENRFAAAELYGKLANIYADLPDEALRRTGTFKMVVSGDPITAEKKFQNPFTFRPYAKLIFSANKLPETRDDTDAFFRRWILIDFPNKFEGDKADPKILEKLTTPEELSGLLNLALKALKRLLDQGGFSYGKTTSQLREIYIRMSDSVGAFIMDEIEVSANDYIRKKELYSRYCEYCRENKLPAVSEQTFHKNIHKYVTVTEIRPAGDGRARAWKGIKFKEKKEEDEKSGKIARMTSTQLDVFREVREGKQKTLSSFQGEEKNVCRNCKWFIPSKGMDVGTCTLTHKTVHELESCDKFERDFYLPNGGEPTIYDNKKGL